MHDKLKTILVIVMLSGCSVMAIAGSQTPVDTLGLYNELCGNYEFYTHERYSPIRIYLENGVLTGKEGRRDPIRLVPEDLSGLRFTATNGLNNFCIAFIRNSGGRIIRFVLATDEWEETAERVLEKRELGLFEPEVLREDFMQMRRALENNHCCLYEYTDKASFDSLFDRQYRCIDRPMGLRAFYQILTPITAKVGCGHTAVWMPGDYWDSGQDRLFPLRIRIIEDRVVVTGSYGEQGQVVSGSVILEINGRPIREIIEEMATNYSADAFNPYFIRSQIERRFSLIYGRRF